MRCFLIALVALMPIFFSGCGEKVEPTGKVYDITANPDNFPPRAIELLKKLESRELVIYDLIVNSFGELFQAHPELLENEKWSQVVHGLGDKFQSDAENLSQRGVSFYLQAAGYYKLASFAKPDDTKLSDISRLFETWTNGVQSMALIGRPAHDFENLDQAVRLVRYFSFGDSLQQAFANEYLTGPYLDKLLQTIKTKNIVIKSLTPANQAYLAYSQMSEEFSPEPLASVTLADLDYLGGELVQIDSNVFRAEIYLEVRDTANLEIPMSLHVTDLEPPLNESKSCCWFEIVWSSPDRSKWVPGSIVAGTAYLFGATSASGAEFQVGERSSGDSETFTLDITAAVVN